MCHTLHSVPEIQDEKPKSAQGQSLLTKIFNHLPRKKLPLLLSASNLTLETINKVFLAPQTTQQDVTAIDLSLLYRIARNYSCMNPAHKTDYLQVLSAL